MFCIQFENINSYIALFLRFKRDLFWQSIDVDGVKWTSPFSQSIQKYIHSVHLSILSILSILFKDPWPKNQTILYFFNLVASNSNTTEKKKNSEFWTLILTRVRCALSGCPTIGPAHLLPVCNCLPILILNMIQHFCGFFKKQNCILTLLTEFWLKNYMLLLKNYTAAVFLC